VPSKNPRQYTDQERNDITLAALDWMSNGESLRSFCLEHNHAYATVWNWVEDLGADDNSPRARAVRAGTHKMADECLEIADDGSNDWMEKKNQDGDNIGWQLNGEHVQRSKLRIDTRLRLIGQWNRREYGSKQELDVAHSGGVTVNIVRFTDDNDPAS